MSRAETLPRGWIWDGSLFLTSPSLGQDEAGAGWTPLAPPSSSPGPCTKALEALGGISPFSLFFPFSQRPRAGISPLSLFSPPLRGQGSRPFRFPSAAVSQRCRHGVHPQPRFWDGFAAFRVIPSPEQWETLLNFRVCWSLPTHHSCGWFELPISSLAQAFNWSSCQRQGGIKGRQVLQEHPPLAGREPRGPSLPPIVVLGSKT